MADQKPENKTPAPTNVSPGIALKATAKAVGGDVAGAALAILKDKQIRNAVICALLFFSFLLVGMLALMGSAITGSAEYLVNTWSENYEESLTNAAVESAGSTVYMYLHRLPIAATALTGTFSDLFGDIKSHFVDGKDATNSNSSELGETDVFTSEDAQITLEAMTDEEALVGANGAIMRRLDMIKKRVQQRGYQIEKSAKAAYNLQSAGYTFAVWAANELSNPILFRGIDLSNSGVSIDTSVFQLTDLQALKILCAFSIQYDCSLADVEMWTLMDYCGWYDGTLSVLPAAELSEESIYAEGNAAAIVSNGLSGVWSAGMDISSLMASSGNYIVQLGGIIVPYWKGSFIPQWAMEEKAAIQDHNEKYWKLVETGAEISEEDQLWGTQASADSKITGFEKLDKVEPYGLIDKIFRNSSACMTLTAEDTGTVYEYIAGEIIGIPDSLIQQWKNAFPEQITEYTDSHGHYVTNDSVTCNDIGSGTYLLQRDGTTVATKNLTGKNLKFTGLIPNTSYSIYKEVITTYEEEVPVSRRYNPLAFDFVDDIGGGGTTTPTEPTEPETEIVTRTETSYELVCSFTTCKDPVQYSASTYKICVNVNISFAALSVDELISDTIGLWSGSITDVTETNTGIYQAGEEGNDLLLYEWNDTYKDANGVRHTVTFRRQQDYQAEAYEDMVIALADAAGIDTSSMYNLSSGMNGWDIVSVALAEIDAYSGVGGSKYWSAYNSYTSSSLDYSNPWCACFVWYCAWLCGYLTPTGDGCFGSTWQIGCTTAFNYMQELGAAAHTNRDYIPSAGDLIFFTESPGSGGFSHIGIVVQTNSDGTVQVAEGNYSNTCTLATRRSYRVGDVANQGGDMYVGGYITPNYPISNNASTLLYTDVAGNLKPTTYAMNIGSTSDVIMMAGYYRMTRSEVISFAQWLATSYPSFAEKSEVAEFIALANENTSTNELIAAWNAVTLQYENQFTNYQGVYATQKIATPVLQAIYLTTDFNWGKTQLRQEILWAIVTTTDNSTAAEQVLKSIAGNLRDSASDIEVTNAFKSNARSTLERYQDALWPDYPDELKQAWINTIMGIEEGLETYSSVQDMGTVEATVFNYLTTKMGFNTAAACGIMGNIKQESDFNPTVIGDNGTSYGLVQWHNSRYSNLISYCSRNGLDYKTALGQLAFLEYELNTSYSSLVRDLKAVPNNRDGAYQAAYMWCVRFEVPASKEVRGIERGNIAVNTYWPVYGSLG